MLEFQIVSIAKLKLLTNNNNKKTQTKNVSKLHVRVVFGHFIRLKVNSYGKYIYINLIVFVSVVAITIFLWDELISGFCDIFSFDII